MIFAIDWLVKVDVDKGCDPLPKRVIRRRLERAGFRLVWLRRRKSPSGKGWHLVVRVAPRPRSPEAVIALQLLLGSDPSREACNLSRAWVLHKMPRAVQRQFNVHYIAP